MCGGVPERADPGRAPLNRVTKTTARGGNFSKYTLIFNVEMLLDAKDKNNYRKLKFIFLKQKGN